ncbi:MAG: glycosyl hydrolase 53 family protein [Alistipes sp.]|nr:glycosyl hydrolase 53 family protein [Alistipes sp.]
MKRVVCMAIALVMFVAAEAQVTIEKPYAVGADISWLQSQEDDGTVFSDGGVEGDAMEILRDNGFNYIRLRLFVNPRSELGYSRREGYCDLEHTLTMAKRIKDAGMYFLLDFHYSDNWADPQKQIMPQAWQTFSYDEVCAAVYEHTKEVLVALESQGTAPDMVQVGNEVSNGMLWPYGSVRHSFEGLCGLLKEGVRAVREYAPSAEVMLHVALGGQAEESERFFDAMAEYGVEYDIIGQSYYPEWHGTLEELEVNTNALVRKYNKPLIVVEYRDHYLDIERIVSSLPDGLGRGTFIWEATSPHWGKLFDETGAATPALDAYNR